MNKKSSSNPVRLIAFFLTAIILACTFGFSVDGWQDIGDKTDTDEDKDPEDSTDGKDENELPTDAEPDQTPEDETPKEPEIYIPEYTSRLTGLEITEEESNSGTLAFVMNADLPTFGLSSAELLCELPTEDGKTRLVAFIPESISLWKIGSITLTRGYISNIAKYFGGILISGGNDDNIAYTSCDISGSELDLSKHSGYHYTEYTQNIYTNCDLLNGGLAGLDITGNSVGMPLPYLHPSFGSNPIIHASPATSVTIKQSEESVSELRYNEEASSYTLYYNGEKRVDAINGNEVEFTNCLVLFADSITYDNSECSQMVMDTIGGGIGYYFTGGSYTEIRWTATSGGIMTFYTLEGEKLTVNRGTTYISFMKSSKTENLTIN